MWTTNFFSLFLLTSIEIALFADGQICDQDECQPFAFSEFLSLPNHCTCLFGCDVTKNMEFYYKSDGNEFKELNLTEIPHDVFKSKGLTVITHGFMSNVAIEKESTWMKRCANQITKSKDRIVILVDYGPIASCEYFRIAGREAPLIGAHIAQVIKDLKVPLEKVELVGHSLGGHIIGFAGCALNGQVGRIISLDPAGPHFDAIGPGLKKECGQYVQVLHTDPEHLGTNKTLGHADFFFNSHSTLQPGCSNFMCDHVRALYLYYTSLFEDKQFIGHDESGKTCRVGSLNTDTCSGRFHINTTACCPYI